MQKVHCVRQHSVKSVEETLGDRPAGEEEGPQNTLLLGGTCSLLRLRGVSRS